MHQIIVCPDCERRLQLPEDSPIELVRCPSCGSEFRADSVPRLATPGFAAHPTPAPRQPAPPANRGGRVNPVFAERPPKASSKVWLIGLLVIGAGFVLSGLGVVGFTILTEASRKTTPAYAPPYAAQGNPANFGPVPAGPLPVPANELAPELKPLFEDLGGALRAADRQRLMSHFDVERTVDEFAALAGVNFRGPEEQRAFARGVHEGIADALVAGSVQWNAFEIRDVKKFNEREVVAVVRHTQPNGVPSKRRWWLTRRSGTWRVYDTENLAVGLRYSVAVGSAVGEGTQSLGAVCRAFRPVREALNAVVTGKNLGAADDQVRQLELANLPGGLVGLRYLALGRVQLQRGLFQQAVTAFEQARTVQPEMPILDFQQGCALNRVGRWEEARQHLEAFRDLTGDDAEVCAELGLSLRGLSRFPDAARAYRKALDLNPKYAAAFLGLLRSLWVNDNRDDVGARFARLDDRRANFDTCAADCELRNFPQLLEALLQQMRKLDPEYASVFYYTALTKARAGQAQLAVPLFRAALRRQANAEVRQHYLQGFLQAMAWGGRYSEAYAAAPDARAAFRFLAAEAMKNYRIDELRQLVATHAQGDAADPLLPWYQAEVYVRDGRYALAEKTFAAALTGPADEETRTRFRASRVLTRYHIDQCLSAYREIGPRPDTFVQLASLCFDDNKDDALQTLLDARAADDAQDVDLLRFRYRLKIRRHQTAVGVALFRGVLAKQLPDPKRAALVAEFLRDAVAAGHFLEGYRAAPEATTAFVTVAEDLFEQDHADDLRRLFDAHRAGHADDPWLAYYEGQLLLRDQAWDKAAQRFGAGLRKAPKESRESFQWQYVYALYKAGRGLQAYQEAEPRDRTFTQLADLLIADQKTAALDELLKARRVHAADDAELFFYEARAQVLAKQPVAAAALLEKACRQQKDEFRRRGYVSRLVLAMAAAGQGLEGYRAIAEKTVAFQALAPRWVYEKKDKELAVLLDEYGKGHADELLLRFYRGELHLLRGEAAAAEPEFAACLAKAAQPEQWRYRNGLFRARIKAGKAAATYQENEPGTRTFEELAYLCSQDKNAQQLRALLDAHAKVRPDDQNLLSWEADAKWLSQDYEGALKLLDEHRDDLFRQPRFRWKSDNYRVRCLVKLKRNADAVRAAENVLKNDRYGNGLLLLLAHAATGDVRQTLAVAAKLRPQPYLLKNCYQDEELGPLLKSEPFRAFREKFPEPKDDPIGGDDDGDES